MFVVICAHRSMCVLAVDGDRGMATSFTRGLLSREAIVCAAGLTGEQPPAMDGALQMKKINKNGAIVSEAMSRIFARVRGQRAARNSSSIGKHICHICLSDKTRTQMDLFRRENGAAGCSPLTIWLCLCNQSQVIETTI